MKKITLIFALIFITSITVAQSPERMSYQTVIRNGNGQLITNAVVGVKITILKNGSNGTIVYEERQTPVTNVNGLASFVIGGNSAIVISGNFSMIDWGNGNYYVKTEIDPSGGSNYSIEGTTQLLSVPYALYAKSAGEGTGGPQGEPGEDGKSAYEIWLENGNEGSETDFLTSLKGEEGEQGPQGDQGPAGQDGAGLNILGSFENESELPEEGIQGDAYLIDGNLYVWSEETWENVGNIQGPQGEQGPMGQEGVGLNIIGSIENESELPDEGVPGEAYLIEGNLYVWSEEEWHNVGNIRGVQGEQGVAGLSGQDGVDGLSAYQIWLNNDNEGSEEDFLISLKGTDGVDGVQGEQGLSGADGISAYQIWLNNGNSGTLEDFLNSLKGEMGEQGPQGEPGIAASGSQLGEMLYWDGTDWVTVAPGVENQVLTFVDGVPTWRNQLVVNPTDVFNPVTGKIWMDRNLGASQVATSSMDVVAYGDLYQWGRKQDGHEKRTSGSTNVLSPNESPEHGNFILSPNNPYDWLSSPNENLWQGMNGVNNPCPSGYRLPTSTEWDAERQSWTTNNATGAFASPLKLPMAGLRSVGDGLVNEEGTSGMYWSSTTFNSSTWLMYFFSNNAYATNNGRGFGHSVRCLRN